MKQKKVPLRMCLSCKEMKPKKELLRVVRNKDEEVSIDSTGKTPGRGAYICKNTDCFEKARAGKRLENAFEAHVNEDIYDLLRQQLEGNNG